MDQAAWMAREYPRVRFERYADDAVVHCVSERQAKHLVQAIGDRMEHVGLRLHPDKTKIVYCKDGRRRLGYEHTAFTFLVFTFRARGARNQHGTAEPGTPSPRSRNRSTPSCAAGCSTTEGSTAPR
jgi:RNA-directed DNA polymerase